MTNGAYWCEHTECLCKTCKNNNSNLKNMVGHCYNCRDCSDGTLFVDFCSEETSSMVNKYER